MRKLNRFEKEKNVARGKELYERRETRGLTQDGLIGKIKEYHITQLEQWGFTEDEVDDYVTGNVSKTLKKKLKDNGLNEKYERIAIATISNYENGNRAIPLWFWDTINEILPPLNAKK